MSAVIFIDSTNELAALYVNGDLRVYTTEHNEPDTVTEALVTLAGVSLEYSDDFLLGWYDQEGNAPYMDWPSEEQIAQSIEQIEDFQQNTEKYRRARELEQTQERIEELRATARNAAQEADRLQRRLLDGV